LSAPTAPPSGPPPTLPKAIYNATDVAGALRASYGTGSGGSGGGDGGDGSGFGVSVEEMVQAREDAFFKEIAQQPSLRRGHPLTHLITAQAKLESVSAAAEQGLAATGATSRKAASLMGASPYAQPTSLVVVARSDRGPSAKQASRAEKNRALDGSRTGGAASEGLGGAMAASSSTHRAFLLQTLNEVQHQLTTPAALKAFVESHTLAGASGSGGGAGGVQGEEPSDSESELDDAEAALDAAAQGAEAEERAATHAAAEAQHTALSDGLVRPRAAAARVGDSTELMRTAFHVEGRYLAVKVRRFAEGSLPGRSDFVRGHRRGMPGAYMGPSHSRGARTFVVRTFAPPLNSAC
jgi:hypothetical protein